MLAVILNILKIIGIILLCIIGLILFLLLLILFVPIRYKARAYKYESNNETADSDNDTVVNAKVTYLLHIVSIIFNMNGKTKTFKLKLFGITIPKKADRKSKKKDSKKGKKRKKSKNANTISNDSDQNQTEEYTVDWNEEEHIIFDENKKSDTSVITDSSGKPQKEEDNIDIVDTISDWFDIAIDFVENILNKADNLEDKVDNILHKINYIERLVDDERNKKAFTLIKKELLRILRSINIRKWKIWAHVGNEDPAAEGNILALVSIFQAIFNIKIDLVPDFDRSIAEFDIDIKGRIIVAVLAYSALKLLLNKNVKRLIRLVKKYKEL